MKRRDYGKFIFAAGLLLLIFQLLMHIFTLLNGNTPDVQFAVEYKLTFQEFISQSWGAILGTCLLVVVFIRRLTKGPDPLLVLVGALLWIIQLLSLYSSDVQLLSFLLKYIVGIGGTVLIVILGFYDAYEMKLHESASTTADTADRDDKNVIHDMDE